MTPSRQQRKEENSGADGRWVNAVITIRVPLDVSPDADHETKSNAALDAFERFDLHEDCAATIKTEVVVDGEPECGHCAPRLDLIPSADMGEMVKQAREAGERVAGR